MIKTFKLELSAQQINLLTDALSDAMQYARENQDDPIYQEKKNEYLKFYHEISNLIDNLRKVNNNEQFCTS